MDPTLSNWLSTQQGLRLLDWEYAGIGHPFWDVAALAINPGLSEQQRDRLIKGYGIRKDHKWYLAEAQMRWLSALWYRAQGLWSDRELLAYLESIEGLL